MAWMLLHPETQDCTQLFQVHFIIKSFDQTGLVQNYIVSSDLASAGIGLKPIL